MKHWVYLIYQPLILLVLAPLVNGVIKKIKAISQKRKGPPIWQFYFDLAKLFRKGMVISETASWFFRATPYVYFGTALVAGLMVPCIPGFYFDFFGSDVILFVAILGLGRFFMTLAGLDTGSTFGGMGSSREMMVATLFEPALLVTLLTTALIAESTSLGTLFEYSAVLGWNVIQPVFLLGFAALFLILIAETARIPADDPATHLELTMIHEAMILEYSGPFLALMEWGASLKQLVLITLMVNLFLPLETMFGLNGTSPLLLGVIYLVKVLLVTVMVGIFEVGMVKLRLFTLPNLAALAFIFGFLGFFQYFILGR